MSNEPYLSNSRLALERSRIIAGPSDSDLFVDSVGRLAILLANLLSSLPIGLAV
jgi:hypothetical protein